MPLQSHQFGHFERSSYGKMEEVTKLQDLGVVDAMGLSRDDAENLATPAGVTEIQRLRTEAEELGKKTGRTPGLYGRQILQVVRVAQALEAHPDNEALAERLETERALLAAKMAKSAILEAEK